MYILFMYEIPEELRKELDKMDKEQLTKYIKEQLDKDIKDSN